MKNNMNAAKSCKIIGYFTIVPVGTESTSIGSYVATTIKAIDKVNGLSYEITPMGTIMEADNLEPILEAVKVAHEAFTAKGVLRIESTLIIDDRKDKFRTMKDKVHSVKKHMKQFQE
jgi:uncharacterized protein (TIGR00106 family)